MKRRRTLHLLVVGAYTLLALGLTWPLVQHLTTHVPGSDTWALDEYTFLWNSWWFRYSLLNLGQSPLYSTHTFYPLGVSLALYTYNLFNAALSVPLQAFLSLPAISNLTFLLATVLSGYGTFLLVEYLLRTADGRRRTKAALPAAFLSGLIFAFGSCRMVYAALGHYDMWSTAWIPFYALYLVKTIREPRLRNAMLAGLFLVLALLCEMIFGVFLGMLTLILVAWSLGRQRRAEVAGGLTGLTRRLAVLAAIAILLYSPVLVPIVRDMLGGYELAGWGDAQKLSVDLLGFVTPTALHPLGGPWAETLQQVREGTARFSDVNTVFVGWTGLALALAGAVAYRRRLAAWITSALVFAVFCLGPLLQINGRSLFNLDGLETTVPLPFILLHYLPVIKANRVPNRFGVVLMLALAVLAGFGIHWLLNRLAGGKAQEARSNKQGVRALLAASCSLLLASLILFEHWSVPLPLTDARIPPVYQQVAADPADFTILQLPVGWRNSFGMQGAEDTRTQYFQSYHHKQLLSGNTSRNPPFKFDYFRRVPILESLITLETYGQVSAERRASDRATAADLVSFYDIRYVVVAPGIAGRPPYVDTRDAAVAYVEQVLPVEKVYDQDGWLLYKVSQTPQPSGLTLDLGSGTPLESMALGEGWSQAEEIQGVSAHWAAAQGTQVFLPTDQGSDYRLTVRALPFDYPGAAAQRVTLWANGRRVETRTLSPGWGSYAWDIPAGLLHAGLNGLSFEFGRLDAPATVLPNSSQMGKTGVQAPLAIEVNSGGPAGFAYISIGGTDTHQAEDGSLHGPGYNLAVLDAKTGKILERASINTTPNGNAAEPDALATYLEGIALGRIVVASMQGDGTAHLSDADIAALRSIGGQVDPRGHSGWSHAIIGVKGAAPGTAMEVAGPGNAWLRVAPDRRTLAMAVDSLTWERIGP